MTFVMSLKYIKRQSITKKEIVQQVNTFFVKERLVVIITFQVQETLKVQQTQYRCHLLLKLQDQQRLFQQQPWQLLSIEPKILRLPHLFQHLLNPMDI